MSHAHQHPPLSPLADPVSLARLQILLVPVHPAASRLSDSLYAYWSSLIRRHAVVRGDEILKAPPTSSSSHRRGPTSSDTRDRFLPSSSGASISRAASALSVHLAFPQHPPAPHVYPLSLVRLSAFPLVVIGVAVGEPAGFAVDEDAEPAAAAGTEDAHGAFEHTITQLFPASSPFPLVRRLVLVPPTVPQGTPRHSSPSKASRHGTPKLGGADTGIVRYAPADGGDAWVARLLGEVVGDVCAELGVLASTLETPAGLKTLSGTLLPSLSSALPDANGVLSPSGTPTADGRHSGTPTALGGISLARALTPGGRPTSVQAPSAPPIQTTAIASPPTAIPASTSLSANPFRRSSALTSPFSRTSSTTSVGASSTASLPANAPKYTSAPLAGIAGGRLMKLLGDMYLLTGMHADAIRCYDDGAEKCRAVGDVFWEALAREGRAVAGIGEAWEGRDGSNHAIPFPSAPIPVEILSHYLSALACIARSPLPFPPTILSPAPQSAAASFNLSAPSLPHANTGTGEGLLAYLYTTLCLRIAHFNLLVWAAGGWGSIALSALMSHSLPRAFPSSPDTADPAVRRERKRILNGLAARSQIPRASVLGHAEAGIGPHIRAMSRPEQLAAHVEYVWLSRWLGLERKEAAGARAVVKRIAGLIVDGRQEGRRLSVRPRESIAGVDGEVGLGLGIAIPTATQVGVRRKEATDGNDAVVGLLERAAEVLGVDLVDMDAAAQHRGEPGRFGWPELQVEAMKEAIAVAEALPDHLAVVRLCISTLRALYPYLNQTSQAHLSKMYPQSLAIARRRGLDISVPWWLPGKVVLSVEIAALPQNRVPTAHTRAEIVPGRKNPFLYNPRLRAEAGKTVLVANEQVDVYVTIQNPFAFDLDVKDLSLITSGVSVVTTPLSIILPASSVQTVRVSGQASSAGTLQIKGAALRLADGSHAEVLLPVYDAVMADKRDKRRSKALADAGKVKRQGLDARRKDADEDGAATVESWLTAEVVEEMPLLWIKTTSLSHGTVMLYDGERSTIRITLENSSPVRVDFVKLSFDDSTARDAQAALDADPSPEQAHEIDYDLLRRPVFSWDTEGRPVPTELAVPAGGRVTLAVNCLGKVGCTDGSIRIDYGRVAGASKFHTRTITLPILFTVYHTLQVSGLGLSRLLPPATGVAAERPDASDALHAALGKAGKADALVAVNVRNLYGLPFQVTLRRKGDTADSGTAVERLVPPGATERYVPCAPAGMPVQTLAHHSIVVPVSRVRLGAEHVGRPVPALSDRQYVVDTRAAPDVARARETYWYREALLAQLESTWTEPGSLRAGSLSLRTVPLGQDGLDVFKLEGVEVELVLDTQAAVRASEFVQVRAAVTNRLEHAVRPVVRIEALPAAPPAPPANRRHSVAPPAPAPPRSALFDGTASARLGVLAPGASVAHAVGALFLATGEYRLRAVVDAGENDGPRFSDVLVVRVE
ncbi:hypothetical protein Q5752_002494 [Cryptotrichosporon argae]